MSNFVLEVCTFDCELVQEKQSLIAYVSIVIAMEGIDSKRVSYETQMSILKTINNFFTSPGEDQFHLVKDRVSYFLSMHATELKNVVETIDPTGIVYSPWRIESNLYV